MTPTTSAAESLWLAVGPQPGYPQHEGQLSVDVAVIGGGIAGLSCALALKRRGARVAALEADRVGHGVTGCSTAKVSALQQTVLSTVRSRHGREKAAVYAQASLDAVEQIERTAREEQIDCELEHRPAVTYAADEGELDALEREAQAADEAGLKLTQTTDVDLPFDIAGALRLDRQLQFHPVKYTRGLARAVAGDGSHVLERTRVRSLRAGAPCVLGTERGEVRAGSVIVATHYPVFDRGAFFARLEPKRSYCIAARVRGEPPSSMSISAGETTRSMRSRGELLIVGGEGHGAGADDATPERFGRLEQFARRHWDVADVSHRWSAQDPVPHDHLPVIGRYMPTGSRVWVASGWMKWGLTGGTIAAMLLAELVEGRDHPWAETFNPHRVSLRAVPKLAQMNAKVALEMIGDRLRPADVSSAAEVAPGHAGVVRTGVGKTGVYRDEAGVAHGVSLRCTHLGCLLRFNGAERSWDCPCHGSRFDVDGRVLEGPATAPLQRREVG